MSNPNTRRVLGDVIITQAEFGRSFTCDHGASSTQDCATCVLAVCDHSAQWWAACDTCGAEWRRIKFAPAVPAATTVTKSAPNTPRFLLDKLTTLEIFGRPFYCSHGRHSSIMCPECPATPVTPEFLYRAELMLGLIRVEQETHRLVYPPTPCDHGNYFDCESCEQSYARYEQGGVL